MYYILGMGIQSKAIVNYLLKNTNEKIISFDPNLDKNIKINWHEHIYDTWDNIKFKDVKAGSVVISTLPTQFNSHVARFCDDQKLHYIDLGGKLSDTEKVIDVDRGRMCIIPDCGIAPGLVSSIAGTLKRKGAESVKLYCGGLPLNPKGILKYIKAFSPEGVYKEYTGLVEYRDHGQLCYMPTLSSRENIYILGLGRLEAEPTSGSISLTARELDLMHLEYKTLRYPGHWDYVKENILWQNDPIQIIDKMTPELSRHYPDIIVLRVSSDIPLIGEKVVSTWFWHYNKEENIGAMAEITGYTVASVATMAHDGLFKNGIVYMHDIDFFELKKRIEKMPNQFLLGV